MYLVLSNWLCRFKCNSFFCILKLWRLYIINKKNLVTSFALLIINPQLGLIRFVTRSIRNITIYCENLRSSSQYISENHANFEIEIHCCPSALHWFRFAIHYLWWIVSLICLKYIFDRELARGPRNYYVT